MKNRLLAVMLVVTLFFLPKVNFGQAPNLGTTSGFALFTASGNFSNAGASIITGNVGTNVGAYTGFPPGTLNGISEVVSTASAQAATDVDVAYSALFANTCGVVLGTTLGNSQVLTANTYCLGAASSLTGNLILDGQNNPNAFFFIKIDGALTTGTYASVSLINMASECNVFWQINGAFTLGDYSVFRGTIVANGAITLLEASSLYGRGLSRGGAISLHNNVVSLSSSAVASSIAASGPTTFCAGDNVILSGNVGGVWSNTATTATTTITTAGDYYVTNTNACGSATSNHIIVTVNPLPTASVITAGSAITFCTGDSVILSGNVGGIWSNAATTATTTITTAGNYYVTNTNACGSTTSNHIIVTVNPLPTASVITAGSAITFCTGDSVILSGNVGGVWSNAATTATTTITTAGDYYVTNTNACGSATSNHIIVTVKPLPTASVITAGSAISFCTGDSVILSGNVGGVWSNAATTATTTIKTAGDYYVTNTNACGSTTSNHIIVTVNPLPIASVITAGGAITFCVGDSVILSGNAGGVWSNTATTATTTITTSGDYYVTNTNSCGSTTSNHIIVTVNPLPTASVITAGSATTFCVGDSVILSGNAGGVWSNTATTATTTITTAGDYYVTNTNSCGSATSNHIIVTVNPLPTASVISAGSAISFCTGDNVILSGNVGGVWSNTATTATTTITTAGDYYVTNTNSCGSTTSNHIIVTVNSVPTAATITAGGPITFCDGGNVILSGNIGGVWSNTATTATTTITTAGDYYVTNTNSCGSATSNHILVTVNPLPTASVITAGSAITFCVGDSVILLGNVGGVWSNTETTATTTIKTAGDYYVTNTNSCGSTTSNHILVTVNSVPAAATITAGGAITFCDGGNVILSGNVGGVWSNAATTATTTITTAGDYYVTNTNSCGSTTSNHILVTVNPLPTASVITAGGATTFCVGDNVILSGNIGGVWSNAATTATTTITTAGDYFVTNTNSCGSATSNHILVTVNALPGAAGIITGAAAGCH